MQTKNKNCTSLNYFNCYKQTQKPHPNRKTFNHINGNLYHYAGNNPVKYTDPTGMWIDNEDGTYTAEKGDTLWDLYGNDWQEKSGYEGDPTKLQVGDVVGKKRESHDLWEASTKVYQYNINENSDKDHHITKGVAEISSGVAVIILGGIATYNTIKINPESTSSVGYGSIMTGSSLIAFGIARLVGKANTTVTEDYKSLFESPLASAVSEFNTNTNGANRSAGKTINYSEKKENK